MPRAPSVRDLEIRSGLDKLRNNVSKNNNGNNNNDNNNDSNFLPPPPLPP